jgi:hypothetical protein
MDWLTGWIIFSIGVGIIAALHARSFFGWAFLSLIISPLLAVIILALMARGDAKPPTPIRTSSALTAPNSCAKRRASASTAAVVWCRSHSSFRRRRFLS